MLTYKTVAEQKYMGQQTSQSYYAFILYFVLKLLRSNKGCGTRVVTVYQEF